MHTQSKYDKVALEAVSMASRGIHPFIAWETAAINMFGAHSSSQKKSCPRNAFLCLAESGNLLGVKAGNYAKKSIIKKYSDTAVKLLRSNKLMAQCSPKELWLFVLEEENEVVTKKHNYQMNIVLTLWHEKKLVENTM